MHPQLAKIAASVHTILCANPGPLQRSRSQDLLFLGYGSRWVPAFASMRCECV
jgi:hypothetical protein